MTANLPVPIGDLPANMPGPVDLSKALQQSLGEHVAATRRERGDVHAPEDTYSLVRSLAASRELLQDYGRAFTSAAKVATQEIEEELIYATGEQDGTPNQGMTVPDARGDLRLSLDYASSYDISVEQLRAVVVAQVANEGDIESSAQAADLAIRLFCEMGNFTPQVSKVKKYSQDTSRAGRDDLASVLTGAISKTSTYRGVKTERKS